jgi:hypothetical protein
MKNYEEELEQLTARTLKNIDVSGVKNYEDLVNKLEDYYGDNSGAISQLAGNRYNDFHYIIERIVSDRFKGFADDGKREIIENNKVLDQLGFADREDFEKVKKNNIKFKGFDIGGVISEKFDSVREFNKFVNNLYEIKVSHENKLIHFSKKYKSISIISEKRRNYIMQNLKLINRSEFIKKFKTSKNFIEQENIQTYNDYIEKAQKYGLPVQNKKRLIKNLKSKGIVLQ